MAVDLLLELLIQRYFLVKMENSFDEPFELIAVIKVFLEGLVLLDDLHEGSKKVREYRPTEKENKSYVNSFNIASGCKVTETDS